MCGMRFGETRSGHDVCNQRYVRADKTGTALANAFASFAFSPDLGSPHRSGSAHEAQAQGQAEKWQNAIH